MVIWKYLGKTDQAEWKWIGQLTEKDREQIEEERKGKWMKDREHKRK